MASRFVNGKENQRQDQTRSTTPNNERNNERLTRAAGARVSSKDKLAFNTRKSTPPINDNTPSRYSNRDSFPDPYSLPEPYHEQHAQPHHQQPTPRNHGIFDETMTSGFDETASDVQGANDFGAQLHAQNQRQQDLHGGNPYFDGQKERVYYGEQGRGFDDEDEGGYEDEDATRHTHIGMQNAAPPYQPPLNHKPNQKPLRHEHQQEDLRRTSDISGRFQPFLQANLELRPVHDLPEENFMITQRKESKKRQRSEAASAQQQQYQEDFRSVPVGKAINNAKAEQIAEESPMEEEDEVETPDLDGSPNRQDENRFSRSSQIDYRLYPDYSDEDLRNMSFADLKKESWDTVPGQAESDRMPEALKGADVTLDQKLEYFACNENAYCSEFFENLSTPEWEESGDMILKKMMAVTQQIISSRESKRKIMAEYEAKYEAREKTIREKSDSYDAKLKQMKNSGQTVLRRKKA